MGEYSDTLFARPSLIEGISRILDFGNTLEEYNDSSDPDSIALRLDWLSVGNNLKEAINAYAEKQEEQVSKETSPIIG